MSSYKRHIKRRVKSDEYYKFVLLKPSNILYFLSSIINLCLFIITTFYFIFIPKIDLDSVVFLDYGNKFKYNYKSYYRFKDLDDKVSINGFINNKKVGLYKLKYRVSNRYFTNTRYQFIFVVDRIKPKITLNGNSLTYVCPGKEYIDTGFKAVDEYDGDISDKVIIKKYKDKIKYLVKDLSGNKNVIYRKLIYKDKSKPIININKSTLVLSVGDKFHDREVSAFDNCDGDISKFVRSNFVDTSTPGLKQILYSVSDLAGNVREVKRDVVVSNREIPKTIYLTFDDGPRYGITNEILDILKKNDVKATFFITNKGDDSLVKREYDEGHSIGIHSASHDYSIIYSSVDNYYKDLNIVSERIKRITGMDSRLVRFPGGSSNTISIRYSPNIMSFLSNDLLKKNYRYFDWNLSSGDAEYGRHTSDEIFDNVSKRLRSDRSNVVLMHDIKPYTRDALERIIIFGRENGYEFKKLDIDTFMTNQKVNN